MLEDLKILAFTYKSLELSDIGALVLSDHEFETRLIGIKKSFSLNELFYISTCNRVEFVFLSSGEVNDAWKLNFLCAFNSDLSPEMRARLIDGASVFESENALEHLFRTSCSMESMVVGEKEILGQVRDAYEKCKKIGVTGDFFNLLMGSVVKTAKEVYTLTKISQKPVSVVSLAYRKLKSLKVSLDANFLIIGAGKTNTIFSKYLVKHGFKNFTVFNRTLSNATLLAGQLEGKAYSLKELGEYRGSFDVIILCTGATRPILTGRIYKKLLQGQTDKKIIIDLAVPNDTEESVVKNFPVHYVNVRSLQEIAQNNLKERQKELTEAEKIIDQNIKSIKPLIQQRRIELALKEVPARIRDIRKKAIGSVFAKEVEGLDAHSLKVMEKVLNYMEKKFISVPMVMAKEILIKS